MQAFRAGLWRLALLGWGLSLAALALAQTAAPAADEATLQVAHQDIATFRSNYNGASPAVRVERAQARLSEAGQRQLAPAIALVPITLGQQQGMALRQADLVLFVLTDDDLEPGSGVSLAQEAEAARQRLAQALQARAEQRQWPVLLRSLGAAALETLALGLLLWGLWWVAGRVEDRLSHLSPRAAPRLQTWAQYSQALLDRLVQLAALFVSAALVFAWLMLVLSAFPVTRALSARLVRSFADAGATVGENLVKAIPGLIVVVVVVLLARAAVEASNAVFHAIAQRRLRIAAIHPETAGATRRLFAVGIWALAMVAAYPYLPGSGSNVFKGVSVLLGAMVTLGSSGVVNQLMSGLVLVYARALRVGDYVVIGQQDQATEGTVQEIGTLATRLITMRNEEVTLPNAWVVSNPIRNYSRQAGADGTLLSARVTIGYDTPWRQVHQLLLAAAARTEGLRAEPQPFVLQRALSDFYVEYELQAYLDRPLDRVPLLSRLHGHMLDCFAAAGVQVMSPHYMAQPPEPVIPPVPPPA